MVLLRRCSKARDFVHVCVTDALSKECFISHILILLFEVEQAVRQDSLIMQTLVDFFHFFLAFERDKLAVSCAGFAEAAAQALKLSFDTEWLIITYLATVRHPELLKGFLIRLSLFSLAVPNRYELVLALLIEDVLLFWPVTLQWDEVMVEQRNDYCIVEAFLKYEALCYLIVLNLATRSA